MAYSSANHERFSERVQKFMVIVQGLRDEGEAIDQVYVNETASGSDSEFVDTPIATKQEHIDAIVFYRVFKDFVEGGAVATLDRRANITPFLQA